MNANVGNFFCIFKLQNDIVGIMEKSNKIFRTARLAAIDKYTIEHEPVSSLELMERAARAWTGRFLSSFEKVSSVAVVAGNGNNGGDGYVIARLLREKGMEVAVFRLMPQEELSADCRTNFMRWKDGGGVVNDIWTADELQICGEAVIVDALFGSGLNRRVTGIAAAVIRRMNSLPNTVVAVDMPSGLMGEDNAGNDSESIVHADYTFTFQFPKLSFMLAENEAYVGRWSVVDIGLSDESIRQTLTDWCYTTGDVVRSLLPSPGRFDHKGINGRGMLVAGHYGMMGAAVLAAKAALHSGIGLLFCHIPVKGLDIMQTSVPEAIPDLDQSEDFFSGIEAPEKYDAVAIGPALGQGIEAMGGLRNLLRNYQGVTIMDADALNLMGEHRELLKLLHGKCILTPHLKEFQRLAGKSENDFDRLNKLSNFAKSFGVHVVLKGANSVIATPEGQLHFNMSGNPGMATGGTGDVLTGVLLALGANGLKCPDIARVGVFVHGLAGDLLMKEHGYRGITAGMIAENMGRAWKKLEN